MGVQPVTRSTSRKLVLEYDGTDFRGWQRQAKGRTVQGVLEGALQTLLGSKTPVIGAGRTDAGVHARGQVASFRTSRRVGADAIRHGLNALLPADVRVVSCEDVDDTFHARKSAVRRQYAYFLSRRPVAIGRSYTTPLRHEVSLAKLQKAAEGILGEHNFSSFCKAKSDASNRVCRVERSAWRDSDGVLVYEITADHFLQHMVRALVGTMLDVGRGKMLLSEWRRVIRSRDRRAAGPTAPSKGLFLEEVSYSN